MSGWGWFILIVMVLIIPISIGGWIFYQRIKAQRAGRDPPPLSSYNPFAHPEQHTDIYPAPSGIVGWAKSTLASFKNPRSKTGDYEQPLRAGRRRGPDPDEAWDASVGTETDGYEAGGYYEEQELGLQPPGNTSYAGGGYGGRERALPEYGADFPRGRSLSRDEGAYTSVGGQKGLHDDPFGDEAERSELRGVSTRPHEEDNGKGHAKQASLSEPHGDSSTERRSMFHENV